MIDWWGILANTLWVAGLAACLAAFSMSYYKAQSEPVTLRHVLQDVGFQLPFCMGMMLVGLGLLFSGQIWGERIIGGLAAIGFVTQAARLWMDRRTDRSES
jgi:ABC-type Fe3+ transport system permease subunit